MTKEQSFMQHLAAEYMKDGWAVVSPSEVREILTFTPDMVLKRGDDHLVVDVKESGYRESRALATLRKIVESNEGWKFEVKVVPDGWGLGSTPTPLEEVDNRIQIVEEIRRAGHNREAFILLWTVVEAVLRANGAQHARRSERLIRESYENSVVSSSMLRILEKGVQLRSRLVHGESAPVSNQDLDELMSAVSDLRHVAPSHAA